MELIVNSTAAFRSSRGVNRFVTGVMQHLDWPGPVTMTNAARVPRLERITELLQRGQKDAILWSPSHRGPLNAYHHVVSVHDCINVEFTHIGDWRLPLFRQLFNQVLKRAQTVVALSQTTRSAIIRNYRIDNSKIVVIPAGYDVPSIVSVTDSEVAESAQHPFVLMVTNALPHKNTSAACKAFSLSRAKANGVQLRVVGSISAEAEVLCRETGVRLEIYDRVDDETLMKWYTLCLFLLSPTLAEGYNLPVAEAVAAGANVLCSDIAVHREFFTGQAVFFDPSSLDCMIAALDEGLLRDGCWMPAPSNITRRNFRDVAGDYRALFLRVAAGQSVQTPS